MSNNIFISYDLKSPGRNYSRLIDGIKTIGDWAHIQDSLWHVKTNLDATQIRDTLLPLMDSNDSIIVIDASHNGVSWWNISKEVANHFQNNWNQ
ncbi:hypothetical protein ACK369_09520 [Aeromonas veronii]|uniref:hypothetical protein n=1 Tax=Aeromonas veronii TaxID=654 RepID=UPI003A388945